MRFNPVPIAARSPRRGESGSRPAPGPRPASVRVESLGPVSSTRAGTVSSFRKIGAQGTAQERDHDSRRPRESEHPATSPATTSHKADIRASPVRERRDRARRRSARPRSRSTTCIGSADHLGPFVVRCPVTAYEASSPRRRPGAKLSTMPESEHRARAWVRGTMGAATEGRLRCGDRASRDRLPRRHPTRRRRCGADCRSEDDDPDAPRRPTLRVAQVHVLVTSTSKPDASAADHRSPFLKVDQPCS